jgi:hypothetical protein
MGILPLYMFVNWPSQIESAMKKLEQLINAKLAAEQAPAKT